MKASSSLPSTARGMAVVVPALNAVRYLGALVPALASQTVAHEVHLIDSSSEDDTVTKARQAGWLVKSIPRTEFGHGRTRNLAAREVSNDIVVFLSQDVLPVHPEFLERLTSPIRDGSAAAAYARQVPGPHAIPTEQFLRTFNYPPESHVRTSEDIKTKGLQAFFFSNAASAYDCKALLAVGGFPEDIIQNEDMILCSRLLRAGHKVAYTADAVVQHTHNYSLRKQFRRYFDIGVVMHDSRDDLKVEASKSRGARYAREQVGWMWRSGNKRWIPFGVAETATKFIAYNLGKRHRFVPKSIKRRISYNPHHWK